MAPLSHPAPFVYVESDILQGQTLAEWRYRCRPPALRMTCVVVGLSRLAVRTR
jgi:hypothetical protein